LVSANALMKKITNESVSGTMKIGVCELLLCDHL